MAELDNKVAVITGAGSGLGKACALLFAARGARVVLGDISGAQHEVAAEIGAAALALDCDVTVEAQVEALIAAATARFGRVDAMLNVAGISYFKPLTDVDMADYDRILDVDLRGVVHGTKHAARAMKDKGGGTILNWSSVAAFGAKPGTAVYSAAKSGVVAITKGAACEYGAAGVRANVIAPGVFLTEAAARGDQAMIAKLIAAIPVGRGGVPEECAELAAFLCSDRARFINGAVMVIDGGQSAQLG